MTTPRINPPSRSKDGDHRVSLTTIVCSIIGVGIVLAFVIVFGVTAFFKHLKQTRIDRENEISEERRSRYVTDKLNSGEEFSVHDINKADGDSYVFQIDSDGFAPIPANASRIKPFLCRIDNMVPDSTGCISIKSEEVLTARLPIDSLVLHNADNRFIPLTLHFEDDPGLSATLTYINADIYNHIAADTRKYHSYIVFVKGFIFESGCKTNNGAMFINPVIDNDGDDTISTFALPDDFAPVAKGATGVRQFVCQVDNIVPGKDGKVLVGTTNARAWLNIDSLIRKSDSPFQPIFLKIKGSNDIVELTEVNVTTRNQRKGGKKSYKAIINGYVYSKNTKNSE